MPVSSVMSSKPLSAVKPEVALNGVVRIPKAVFESLPPPEEKKAGVISVIKRLDGTIEEVTNVMPDNPNFAPRKAWPGGNIVTSNKDEALIKYYERKGIPLPPELQAKKVQVDAAAAEKKAGVFSRLGGGGKARTSGTIRPGGAFSRLAGKALGEISFTDDQISGDQISGDPVADAAAEVPAPDRWPNGRPKGGVKLLSGAEGAMRDIRGEKRPPPAAAAEGSAKRAVTGS